MALKYKWKDWLQKEKQIYSNKKEEVYVIKM